MITVEALENKLNEVGTIAFRCKKEFYGMYKAERNRTLGNLVKIHSEGEKFLLRNDNYQSTAPAYT